MAEAKLNQQYRSFSTLFPFVGVSEGEEGEEGRGAV
jgi:hypothetical protein